MRRTIALVLSVAVGLFLVAGVSAQCVAPNITATVASPNVLIGTDLVVDYVTPRHFDGRFVYTLLSLYPGATPIGEGYCLPLSPPFTLIGASYVAVDRARFRLRVPADKSLVGLSICLAGMVVDGTPAGTGASNGVLVHLRLEDWPLP
ncbi:MAG: hypothetical protein JXQ29_05645 [Planctomycetes bacterium]|nr:hypothetical protein [Planctomycetota bacterium]